MPSSKKRSSEAKGKRSGDAGGHMAGLMGLGLYGGAGAKEGRITSCTHLNVTLFTFFS